MTAQHICERVKNPAFAGYPADQQSDAMLVDKMFVVAFTDDRDGTFVCGSFLYEPGDWDAEYVGDEFPSEAALVQSWNYLFPDRAVAG